MNYKKIEDNIYNALWDYSFAENTTQAEIFAEGYITAIAQYLEEKVYKDKLSEKDYDSIMNYVDIARTSAIEKFCKEKGWN